MNTHNDKPTSTTNPLLPPEDPWVKGLAKRAFSALLFIALMTAFIWGAVSLQSARCAFDTWKAEGLYEDNMFLPQPKYSKLLAFGHDELMADMLYLRAVQAFGGQQYRPAKDKDYSAVFNFFDTIIELDPHFKEAILFGQMTMSESQEYEKGLEIGRKGYVSNPEHYRFAFSNAFTCIYETKQWNLAEFWVQISMQSPDCPEWVESMISKIKDDQGLFAEGVEFSIRRFLRQIQSGSNPYVREIIIGQIERSVESLQKEALREAIDEYKKANDDKLPGSLVELTRMPALREYDDFDFSQLKMLLTREALNKLLSNERRTKPNAKYEDLFDRIVSLVKTKSSGIPRPTTNTPEDPDYYVMRKDLSPKNIEEGMDVLMTRHSVREYTKQVMLPVLREEIDKFFQTNSHYPNTLEEAFPEAMDYSDPITGKINYDPETGTVMSPSFPNL